MNTAIRTKAATLLLTATAAAALALGAFAASPANADTFPGPAGVSGEDVIPAVIGTTGNPANIRLNQTSNQVVEDAFDSGAWTQARTFGVNHSNAQRVYFQKIGTRTLVWGDASAPIRTPGVGVYKIMHYPASGGVLCLDADGSRGAPGAGAAVSWYRCDPNFVNQPNQLWTYVPVSGRPDDTDATAPALVNVGSLDQQNMDVRTAPILTAGANGLLALQSQATTSAASSSWELQNLVP